MVGVIKNREKNDWLQLLDWLIVGALGCVLAYSIHSKRLLKVSFCVALIAWILKQILLYKSRFYRYLIPKTFINKAVAFWVIALVLSAIFSLDFKYSQRVLVERYLPFIVFFLIATQIASNKKYLKFLVGVFLIAATVVGIGCVWDYFTLKPQRLFSSFGKDGLSLYYYFTLVTPLSVIITLFYKGKLLRMLAFIASLVCIPALVWNFYRGAIVGLILSVLIITWLKNRKLFIAIILILLILSFFTLPARYTQRMSTTFNPDTWGSRPGLWQAAINIWQDYPVFGAGIRQYRYIKFDYQPYPGSIKPHLMHAHNTYLQILAEIGILGIVSFLYLFFVFFRQCWRKREVLLRQKKDHLIIALGVIAVIIDTLIFGVSNVLYILFPSFSSILWILFGFSVGVIEKVNNDFSNSAYL